MTQSRLTRHCALALVITALVYGAFVAGCGAPVGATAVSGVRISEARTSSAVNSYFASNVATKKRVRKKAATGLMAKVRHYLVVLVVLVAIGFAVFLIGSGVRRPQGRTRERSAW